MFRNIIYKIRRLFKQQKYYWFCFPYDANYDFRLRCSAEDIILATCFNKKGKALLLNVFSDRMYFKYLGLCPFHEEKTPSFTVTCNIKHKEGSLDYYLQGDCHCLSCSAEGKVVDLLQKHKVIPFFEVF